MEKSMPKIEKSMPKMDLNDIKVINTNCLKCNAPIQYSLNISDIPFWTNDLVLAKAQEAIIDKMVTNKKFFMDFMENLAEEIRIQTEDEIY